MKPLQLDHADLADRMIQGGALSFSSIWNHINKYLPDEAYTLINARLSRIKRLNKKQNGTPFVRQVYEYACAGKWGVFYMAQRLRQWLFWFSSRVRVATMPDLPDRRM